MATNPVSIGDISGIAFQGVGMGILAGTAMGTMRMMERGLYDRRYPEPRTYREKRHKAEHLRRRRPAPRRYKKPLKQYPRFQGYPQYRWRF